MFALMIASRLSAQLTAWLLPGFCLAVHLMGSVTAPTHVRRLACGVAVAIVLAAVATVPTLIIRCDPAWMWPWC